jgi:SAM-dependent methyltransferase
VRAARRAGRSLRVVSLDQNADMIDLARARSAGFPEIEFVRGDGTSLPFGDGAFDVTISAATLHHLEPPAAVIFLRELRRVARLTPIVADLRREPPAYLGARLIALISTNRLTKNDAPLSVRRSYTPAESVELARAAGWRAPAVRRTMWFRQLLRDAGAS